MKMTRRDFIPLAGAGLLAGYAAHDGKKQTLHRITGTSAVAVVKASSYTDDLAGRMLEGIRECGLDVRGKKVLLKPNLVEFDPNTCINTNVAVIAAAYEVFRSLGAATLTPWPRWRATAVKFPISMRYLSISTAMMSVRCKASPTARKSISPTLPCARIWWCRSRK